LANIKINNNNKLEQQIRPRQMPDTENIILDIKFLAKPKCRELKRGSDARKH